MTGSGISSRAAERYARLLWLPVAWSAVLFGAVYPWAYLPLLAGVTAIGAYGWMTARPPDCAPALGVSAGLLLVALVVALQVLPLPAGLLARVSPGTDAFARQYDVVYAAGRAAGTAVHAVSVAPDATLRALGFLVALGIFLAGSVALMPRVRLGWLVRRLVTLGVLLAVFGIAQKATYNNRLYWVWTPIEGPGNAFGPFVNRNHFAGWMVMAGALTAGYLCGLLAEVHWPERPTWRQRLAALGSTRATQIPVAAGALVVIALSTVWTLSRSGIAAFVVGLGLVAVRMIVRFSGARRAVGVSFLAVTIALAIVWRDIDTVVDWYSRTGSLAWRVQLWRDTLPIIRDFPWLGTGLNTYGVATLAYPMTDTNWHALQAHSDYVQIVSDGGLALAAAAGVTLWLLASAIRRAFLEPQPPRIAWIRTGATAGLVAIGVQELTEFSLQTPGDAVLFVLLAAIALHRAPRNGLRSSLTTTRG